jgi:GNAT superfamily N-acetyltransferase
MPADNDDLVALSAACPMRAAMTLCVHRHPDFFALNRVQGDPWVVFVAEDPREGIIGCVAGAVRKVWIRGRPKSVMYTVDFKLHPRFRGRGLADRLLRMGWPECDALGVPSLMGVLAGNAPIERRLLNPPDKIPKPGRLGTVRVYSLILPGLALSRPSPEIEVRPAAPADLPSMLALWDRIGRTREGAPVLDAQAFEQFLDRAPGFSLGDTLLAFRGTELVGSVGVWNQDSFKETRVLDYRRSVSMVRRIHNLVARPLGWPLLPDRGAPLRALHAVHLFVPETEPAALTALLQTARKQCVQQGASIFELGLDPRDPLGRALRPFPRIGVDVNCFLTPDPGSSDLPVPGDGPFHFETALV